MSKKITCILLVLAFGIILTAYIVKQKARHEWLSLIEGLYYADRVEVTGYTTDKIVLSGKGDVDQFMEYFNPVLNVNSQKKLFNRYLSEQLFEIDIFTDQSEVMKVQVYGLAPKIESEIDTNSLHDVTFKIDNVRCIAIIEEQYCRISPFNKNLSDFLGHP